MSNILLTPPMPRLTPRLTIGVAAALLAAAACSKKPDKPAPAATVDNAVKETDLTRVRLTTDAVRRLGIETATIDSTTVTPSRTVGGEVVVPAGQSLIVSAPVAGTILAPEGGAIPPSGTRVGPGQPIMRLVALPPDRDLMRTGQDVAVAEARLRQAEAEAARVAALYADRLIAAREHERAQADLAAARATMEAATGTQRLVRGGSRDAGGLTALRIDAPDGGVMRALHVGAGQSVAAGAPLAEILRTDRMWVRVPVYAGEAARFGRGEATVHGLGGTSGGALGGPVLRAQRVAAPPSADATAASVDLFYEVRGGTASLRPGERVGVTIPLTGIGERRLVVPLAAVVRDLSGGSWVYERTDSVTFVRRRVEVAQVVGPNAVLAAGPKPGTVVVTAGAAELFGTEFGVGK